MMGKKTLKSTSKNTLFKKQGFSLAEILLALTITGIIASLTIPNLIYGVQNMQWKAAYKKNYSMISQATLKISDDNNGTMADAFEDIPDDGWSGFDKVPTKYSYYMNIAKTCKKWSTMGECFPAYWEYLNGDPAVGTGVTQTDMLNISGGVSGAILSDGTSLAFSYLSASCTTTSWITNDICGYIMIDVNGFKGPSVWGKDIYGLYIMKDGSIKPFGLTTDEVRNTTCIEGDTGVDNLGLKCSSQNLTQ